MISTTDWLAAIGLLSIPVSVVGYIKYTMQGKDLKRARRQFANKLDEKVALSMALKNAETDRDAFKQRCEELEDSIEKEYKVKIRHVHNITKCEYDQYELQVLAESLEVFVSNTEHVENFDDVKFVTALYDKTVGFIKSVNEGMTDEEVDELYRLHAMSNGSGAANG